MRIMDGLMAIPAILLAIALGLFVECGNSRRSSWRSSFPKSRAWSGWCALLCLTARHEPYVEAAITGSGHAHFSSPSAGPAHPAERGRAVDRPRHLYLRLGDAACEAILSFLGIGVPPEIPTWGNIMAEGRQLFRLFPHDVCVSGNLFLGLTVLAIDILGDGLRDALDPKLEKRA